MRARRFRYSPGARRDIADIRKYLSANVGRAIAARVLGQITRSILSGREAPDSGSPQPQIGPRCRLLVERSYLIYYDYDGETFVVLRVLHHARDRDAIMGGS